MKRVIVAGVLAAVCVWGFFVGRALGDTCVACQYPCNGVDGVGPIGWISGEPACSYTDTCPTATPGKCQYGWCRTETCSPCPNYTTSVQFYECNNEQNCKKNDPLTNYCRGQGCK